MLNAEMAVHLGGETEQAELQPSKALLSSSRRWCCRFPETDTAASLIRKYHTERGPANKNVALYPARDMCRRGCYHWRFRRTSFRW